MRLVAAKWCLAQLGLEYHGGFSVINYVVSKSVRL